MKISEKHQDKRGHAQFEVVSDSGNTYTVVHEGGGDEPGEIELWSCTCPAGQFGRACRHVAAVLAQLDEAGQSSTDTMARYTVAPSSTRSTRRRFARRAAAAREAQEHIARLETRLAVAQEKREKYLACATDASRERVQGDWDREVAHAEHLLQQARAESC